MRIGMTVATVLAAGAVSAFECSEAVKAKARDFIDNEKQFHLGFLPTEQSNPITATLEEDFKRSTLAGVQCLQRGDRQIPITMRRSRRRRDGSSSRGAARRDASRSCSSRCGATSSTAVRPN